MDMNDSYCNQSWLKQCPFAMMALDDSGVIRWVNTAFEELTGFNEQQLLGTTLENHDSAQMSEILSEKSNFSIEHEGKELNLIRILRRVDGPNDSEFQMHYFQPQRSGSELEEENQQLRKQVESLTLTDELTGLANERALSQNLATQVTRSRRYNNPLSLAIFDVSFNGNRSHVLDDVYHNVIVSVSHFLRERLRWADFIAHVTDGRFIIVLPETAHEEATRLFDDIVSDKEKIDLPDDMRDKVSLNVGVAEWEKGNDPRLLVERAAQELV